MSKRSAAAFAKGMQSAREHNERRRENGEHLRQNYPRSLLHGGGNYTRMAIAAWAEKLEREREQAGDD